MSGTGPRWRLPLRNPSIALIVSAALATAVTLVLLAAALLFYNAERERRWAELHQVLAASADQLAVAVALPAWNFDEDQILVVMRSVLNNPNLYGAVVSATANQHSYWLQRGRDGQLVEAPQPAALPGMLDATRKVRAERQTIGYITVYANPALLLDELRQRRLWIIGGIVSLDAALVLCVYLLLWYLMLKPLKAVGQYAAAVAAGGGTGAVRLRACFLGELRTLNASIQRMVALLDSRYRALRQSEERLGIATRAANVGIWDWDVVRNELVWDDKMFEHFKVERGRFNGAYEAWSATVLPEDLPYAAGEVQAALRGEREYECEFRIRWPDGSIRHIRAESLTFRDQQGRALRMVGVNYDVTAARVAEQELLRHRNHLEELVAARTAALQAAVTEAKAASRAKSVFLATMSHELRTPLNSVIGFSRLMAGSRTMSADEKRNLAIIHRSGQHLLRLINDILELSKIEAGRAVLQSEAVDLRELAQEVMDMVGARAQQSGLRLALRHSGLPPAVRVDGAKLRQVLLNLMSNAVKFVERGGVTLELHGRLLGQDRHAVSFAVRDSGIGIAAEDVARIFEPFFQVDDNGRQEGTGLGLAISRDFVQMMGGRLEVESVPGSGSVFRFTIEAEASASAPQPPASEVSGLAPPQRGRRILVVDDNADAFRLLAGMLAPLGFDLSYADGGAAALEALARAPCDLVLLDWRMPGLDGLEVTRRLRADAALAQPRVVVLTASAFEDEQQEALAAGADDFLRKPIEHERLFQVLEQQLGLSFLREQAAPDAAHDAGPSPQQLQALPPDTRAALRLALRELNQSKVAEILDPYRAPLAALVEAVERRVTQYQFRQLCQLIDEADGEGR